MPAVVKILLVTRWLRPKTNERLEPLLVVIEVLHSTMRHALVANLLILLLVEEEE